MNIPLYIDNMYTLILIEVQFTRLVSITPFVTLVLIFTNTAWSLYVYVLCEEKKILPYFYVLISKSVFQLSSYQNWKSKQNNNQKSHYICFNWDIVKLGSILKHILKSYNTLHIMLLIRLLLSISIVVKIMRRKG